MPANLALRLLNIALRRARRQGWSLLLWGLPVTAGVMAVLCATALVDGIDDSLLNSAMRSTHGAMRITAPQGIGSVPAAIVDQLSEQNWASRTKRLGIIRAEQRLSVDIVGIEARDPLVFNPKYWAIDGKWPPRDGVAIGSGLASALALKINDSVVLETDWHSGGQNAQSYAIESIVETGFGSTDQRSLWMTQERLSELRGERLVSELVLRRRQTLNVPDGWLIETPQETLRPWIELNQTRRVAFLGFSWLLMLLAAVGVFSTTLLQTQLRQKELGMLRAIGFRPGQLTAVITMEMAVVSAGFGLIGVGAAALVIAHWQHTGIDLSSIIELIGSSPFPTVVYARASWMMTTSVIAASVLISVVASGLAVRPITKQTPAALLEEQ